MYCKNCGKEITGNESFCPHCGAAINAAPIRPMPRPVVQPKRTNEMCIVGLSFAALSFLFNGYGVISIAGLILSIFGLKDCKKKNEDGRTIAIIGICLSIATLILAIVHIVLSVFVFRQFGSLWKQLLRYIESYIGNGAGGII